MELNKYKNIYFIGIGGSGMSALANYFVLENKKVSGYDKLQSANTNNLESKGVEIIYNDVDSLLNITKQTAAVVIEPIQGGTGFVTPTNNFLQKVRERCNQTGTLLILDEIQTCFGRLGTLFGFEKYNIIPDILCIV